MEHFPVFLDLKGQPCLVIGGGGVAARKIRLLLDAGARVWVAAERVDGEVAAWVEDGAVDHLANAYSPALLDEVVLVFAATDDEALNRRISTDCRARRLPVNVVDNKALCSFIMPAIVDRAPVTLAISSGGDAPVLARQLRARLESTIPSRLGELAALAGEYRERVKREISDPIMRRRFWEQVLDGAAAERALAGDSAGAKTLLETELTRTENEPRGEVYLVGAGPGEPDLLTFRALRLMQRADVVLYDRLIAKPILDLVRRDAERIYVGKRRKQHTLPQEELNALMVRLAKEGKRVLRLKGGDPFLFGRGGEEIATLAEANIPFQIVPGISAANGCAAYAGIPLTHRDYAQSCRFVTGHRKSDAEELELDWASLVRRDETLVFYMGLLSLPTICRRLVEHGLPNDWPAALVERGTTRRQRVIIGDLSNLAQRVEDAGIDGPSLVIVGQVVGLHRHLNWFDAAGQMHPDGNVET